MMTLREQKEAPWPGGELFSIDTYPLLLYGSRKIFSNWNILSLEDFEGRMNAAIERNAFLESELDEKVGGKNCPFLNVFDPGELEDGGAKVERRDQGPEVRVESPQPSSGEMLLFCFQLLNLDLNWWDASILCVLSFILVLQSEDEEPDNDRQMEELQQDSNKKVTLHFINLNMG